MNYTSIYQSASSYSFALSVTIRGGKGLIFRWLWFYTTFGRFCKDKEFLDWEDTVD